jgi:hypothetical protein
MHDLQSTLAGLRNTMGLLVESRRWDGIERRRTGRRAAGES